MATTEVIDGLAALRGAVLEEDELSLLAAGARARADLALLPAAGGQSRTSGKRWRRISSAAPVPSPVSIRARNQSSPLSVGLVHAEHAHGEGRDSREMWRSVEQAWQLAGQPYREAYARCVMPRSASGGGISGTA